MDNQARTETEKMSGRIHPQKIPAKFQSRVTTGRCQNESGRTVGRTNGRNDTQKRPVRKQYASFRFRAEHKKPIQKLKV